jgi:hypothetical protein
MEPGACVEQLLASLTYLENNNCYLINHSPPDSAEVKKMWIYTSTPLYAFMA